MGFGYFAESSLLAKFEMEMELKMFQLYVSMGTQSHVSIIIAIAVLHIKLLRFSLTIAVGSAAPAAVSSYVVTLCK